MQQGPEPIRNKLIQAEAVYKTIEQQITQNLKYFNDIVLDNRQTFQSIERNLEDIQAIYEKDIDKFSQNVDKGIAYNESLYDRVEKDVHYLHNDLDNLKKKIAALQKRTQDMENQVGNMNYHQPPI